MLIAFAVALTLCEAFWTALEVAMNAVSRARLRSIVESERTERLDTERNENRRLEDRDETTAENSAAKSAHGEDKAPAETATRVSPLASKLEHRAARTLRLLEEPERLTLLFITLTSLSLWAAATCLTWQARRDNWPIWQLSAAFVGVLFVAEVLPLMIAARNPEGVALLLSGAARGALRTFAGPLWLLGTSGKTVARLLGAGVGATTQVTQGELRTALAAAEEEGVIESDERALLEGAMAFREKRVHQVMTPRVNIVGVPAATPLREALAITMREGHSRLPVYDGSLDTITGILSTKDLLPHLRVANSELRARDVAREPYFVPLNKRIAPTLEELRRQRSLMAIAIDENGGTAGLVTLEDLLEEIVGEIQDEHDDEEPRLRVETTKSTPQNGRTFDECIACDAAVSLREAKEFWRTSFAQNLRLFDENGDEADSTLTLASLGLRLFNDVPQVGDAARAGILIGQKNDEKSAEKADGKADGKDGKADIKEEPRAVFLCVVAMSGPRIESVRLEVRAVQSSTELSKSEPSSTSGATT